MRRAKIVNGLSIVLTFDIPPVNLISGQKTKKLIMPFEEKIRMINNMGVDYIISVNFNREFANLSKIDFCRKIILEKINASEVFIGENFRFGKSAEGDFLFLKNFLKENGRIAHAVKLLKINNIVISSTIIRDFYDSGNIDKIRLFLGRYPSIEGTVQKGLLRGAELGFPTANIEVDDSYIIPKNGVYIGKIKIQNSNKFLPSIINIGNNPTFGYRKTLVEAHILNFKNNIYSKKITIIFLKYLRDERRFNLIHDLVNQINEDIKSSVNFFKSQKKS
ncbi:MAG: riboflavin biosynthesis protein RibF [Actinobacteria bacterium]|nr:riboflavin biosynthesis protein RibF [Actinomycetota bacterium]